MKIINCLVDKILSKTPEAKKKKIDKSLLEFFGILAALTIIFLIWVYYPTFVSWMDKPSLSVKIPLKPSEMVDEVINSNDFQKVGERFGTYGDSYGSLNTLFSGFAFAILIISLFMQRQELKEQRKELEAQRNEIKESNSIAEAQRKITAQQATLIEQQINDSKIQSFYDLLFRYIDEKNQKIKFLLQENQLGHRGLKFFLSEIIYGLRSYYLVVETFLSVEDESLDLTFYEILASAHRKTDYLVLEMEYVEFINFILRFIEMHEDLGVLDHAIKTFISYQTIDEMHCMAYLAFDDEELSNYIKKYALLRKVNTFEDDELFLAFIERLYGSDSYSP
ncbi:MULTISPECIES: hypothetical protein [unclassified Acinetobacter]|uniref:hypothetical protein n=1 Tax=unclassified Acinetobacter TaxID=196816 RepID=UPI00190E2788|nr:MULTISPECIES: hypothetical protein [unclassified Acinetobacter]MBK0062603.1 hypothetical protein [Acinetobacter sp. S55]MBK0065820.1 hypothetical protein [Acinetobacter sp. S54]